MARTATTRLMFEEYAHAKKFTDTYTTADGIYDRWITPVVVDEYRYAVSVRGTTAGVKKVEESYIRFMQQGRGKACVM